MFSRPDFSRAITRGPGLPKYDVRQTVFTHTLSSAMDVVLDIVDELIFDKLYAAAIPLSAFLPKAAANITAPLVSPPGSSLWTSVVSSLPHPPLAEAADAALRIAEAPSALPTWLTWLAQFGSPAAAASAWPRDYIPRQLLSLTVVTLIGIHVLYFLFAALSYYLIFDHDMMKHPRFLKVCSSDFRVIQYAHSFLEPSKVRNPMRAGCIPRHDTSHPALVFGS